MKVPEVAGGEVTRVMIVMVVMMILSMSWGHIIDYHRLGDLKQ